MKSRERDKRISLAARIGVSDLQNPGLLQLEEKNAKKEEIYKLLLIYLITWSIVKIDII